MIVDNGLPILAEHLWKRVEEGYTERKFKAILKVLFEEGYILYNNNLGGAVYWSTEIGKEELQRWHDAWDNPF